MCFPLIETRWCVQAVCFVVFFCAAKTPRIEALKLQMCVMVISSLFALILMTDLIPVFKRPTETHHRLDI